MLVNTYLSWKMLTTIGEKAGNCSQVGNLATTNGFMKPLCKKSVFLCHSFQNF